MPTVTVLWISETVKVKRYIADNSVEIVNVAADIDGDGKVNTNDPPVM